MLIKKRGLYETGRVVYISPSDIYIDAELARTDFDLEAMCELTVSINKYGVLQPLTVRRRAGGGYDLISGQRRLRAARMAGLTEVPCIILDVGAEESAALVLVENIQRRSLDFIEEARALGRLRELYGYSQEETARLVGLSQPAVANKLRLLRLPPELLYAVRESGLTERHARTLLRLPNEGVMAEVLARIISEDMNVAAAEAYVENVIKGKLEPEPPTVLHEEPAAETVKLQPPEKIFMIRDHRFFVNTVERGAETMRRSGMRIELEKTESEKDVVLHIRILKKRI